MYAFVLCLCFCLLEGLQCIPIYGRMESEGYDRMSAIKKNEKYIPTKNYITAIVLILAIVLLSLYFFEWYKVYQEDQVKESYLVKNGTITNVVNIEEIETVFVDTPPEDYFVYISYTGDKDIYEMEKELVDVINEYDLNDKFYFINVTDSMEKKNYIDELNASLQLEEQKITKVPTILYVKNGELAKDGILTREDDHIINAGDFAQFLETKEYQK